MGTIADKLLYLAETKNEIKKAINTKRIKVTETTSFRDYAKHIKPQLQKKEITPGAENVIVSYDANFDGLEEVAVKGDANLKPENIKDGVRIFGVLGTHEGEGGGGVGMPEEYQELFPLAETLCGNEYANVMIAENDEYITFAFLTDAYAITDYDAATTQFHSVGWYSCNYTKADATWEFLNYTSVESPGGNFAKNIKFADCYIEYNGMTLFPVGINNYPDTVAIDY